MKKEIGRDGRVLYKFSHSVCQGGYVYVHKTKEGHSIQNKFGLRNFLIALSKKLELIDATVKVYDKIIFVFFQTKPLLAPRTVADRIVEGIYDFGQWDEHYLFTGCYDLQEEYLRKDMEKFGFDYDKG